MLAREVSSASVSLKDEGGGLCFGVGVWKGGKGRCVFGEQEW